MTLITKTNLKEYPETLSHIGDHIRAKRFTDRNTGVMMLKGGGVFEPGFGFDI